MRMRKCAWTMVSASPLCCWLPGWSLGFGMNCSRASGLRCSTYCPGKLGTSEQFPDPCGPEAPWRLLMTIWYGLSGPVRRKHEYPSKLVAMCMTESANVLEHTLLGGIFPPASVQGRLYTLEHQEPQWGVYDKTKMFNLRSPKTEKKFSPLFCLRNKGLSMHCVLVVLWSAIFCPDINKIFTSWESYLACLYTFPLHN